MLKTRWLKRFRPPVLFGLGAAVALTAPDLIADRLGASERFDLTLSILGRILIVVALGWTVTTVIDALIKRRMAQLATDANAVAGDNLLAGHG